jgi:hypothetical protein
VPESEFLGPSGGLVSEGICIFSDAVFADGHFFHECNAFWWLARAKGGGHLFGSGWVVRSVSRFKSSLMQIKKLSGYKGLGIYISVYCDGRGA